MLHAAVDGNSAENYINWTVSLGLRCCHTVLKLSLACGLYVHSGQYVLAVSLLAKRCNCIAEFFCCCDVLSVCLFVCLSVTRVYCEKTTEARITVFTER